MTQRMLRIFIKPDGERWFTTPLKVPLQQWWANATMDRIVMYDDFAIPLEQIHHVAVFTIEQPAQIIPFGQMPS